MQLYILSYLFPFIISISVIALFFSPALFASLPFHLVNKRFPCFFLCSSFPLGLFSHLFFFVFHFVPREMGIRSLTQAVPEEEAAEEEVLSLLIAIRIMVSSFLSTFPSLLVSHPDKIISRKESKSAASKS